MAFDSFQEFINMGRHGAYVWAAYGLSFLILLGNVLAPLRQRKQILTDLARKKRREQQEEMS